MIPVLKEGDRAPDFSVLTDSGETVALQDFRGQKLVLYFYPKDDTSGCTAEACAFNDNLLKFRKRKTAILGISRDSIQKHGKFRDKYNLRFPLGADENGDICERYGVWIEKSMYGKKYMGIERSTFLIDESGKMLNIWRKVKVPGHADDVIAATTSGT